MQSTNTNNSLFYNPVHFARMLQMEIYTEEQPHCVKKMTPESVSFPFLFCCESLSKAFPHGGKANSHLAFV